VERREGSRLVTSGLYTRVRNPLYSVYLVELIGFVLIAPNLVTASAFVMVLLPILYRIPWKNGCWRNVTARNTRTYRSTTKRLIPFIY